MISFQYTLLVALLSKIPATSAQNSTFNSSSYKGCPGGAESYAPDAAVNSTGKIEFQFGGSNEKENGVAISNKWYLSVTFNDTRRQSTDLVHYNPEVEQQFRGWLSVETRSSGQVCAYRLGGVNASTTSSGNNGCDGVLSTACISALRDATQSDKVQGAEGCPSITITEEAKKVCAVNTDGSGFLQNIVFTGKCKDLDGRARSPVC